MNACDDETEPLGESPDIDTLGAIQRGAVIGILSAADRVTATVQLAERQTQALNKVRELHYTVSSTTVPHPYCHECYDVAPCQTIRALAEAGA